MTGSWERSDNEVLAALQDVVAIESVNPSLPGGRDGEGGMVEYLSGFFDGIGLPFELSEALPGRHNLIARLEGEDPDRALLFECHMDTASVEVMSIPPFEPHIRNGLMYGRGSADTKAGRRRHDARHEAPGRVGAEAAAHHPLRRLGRRGVPDEGCAPPRRLDRDRVRRHRRADRPRGDPRPQGGGPLPRRRQRQGGAQLQALARRQRHLRDGPAGRPSRGGDRRPTTPPGTTRCSAVRP